MAAQEVVQIERPGAAAASAPVEAPPLEEAELATLMDEAQQLAASIIAEPDDRGLLRQGLSKSEEISKSAGDDFRLLRSNLGRVMDDLKESGATSSVPGDLIRLRTVMDDLNPYPALQQLKDGQTAGFFSRLFRRVPGIGKILANIAIRYESVQTQVDSIIMGLERGMDKLSENAIEIEQRYERLKALKALVRQEAYRLQLVADTLNQALAVETDADRKTRLERALAKVMRRMQNLVVTEHAFSQFFVTMNLTMDNHENLIDGIRSMVDLTRPVLENGLALAIAQQDEERILKALAQNQEFLSDLMVQVADSAKAHGERIAQVADSPLIKIESLVKSYNTLLEAAAHVDERNKNLVEQAQKNISELSAMTETLDKVAQDQEDAREALK